MNSKTKLNFIAQGAGWSAALVLFFFSTAPAFGETQFDWQPPAFEIAAPDGDLFSYPDNLNGPTIVLFWASWCPYCKSLMPHLQSIVDEYEGKVEVLALNFRDEEDPAAYLEEFGYSFRLLAQSDEVAEDWGIKGTPGLFLADGSGRVVFNRLAIPKSAYRTGAGGAFEDLKHYQIAARHAPFWAARLRLALDQLLETAAEP